MADNTYYVIKRKGIKEPMDFNKIQRRIGYLVNEPYKLHNINIIQLTQAVVQGLVDGINTVEIDLHTANLAASMSIKHRDYLILAGRVAINNHHKNTLSSFKDKINLLYLRKDQNGKICSLINDNFYKYVEKNQMAIDKHIDYSRDYAFDFFGFKTLEKGYLLAIDGKCVERPQDLLMRVAIQIHMPLDESEYRNEYYLKKIFHMYDMMSMRYYTHATPTLFNAGTNKGNYSSCFLLGSQDSLEGIMKTLSDSVQISKWSGGIGVHLSSWRGEGSLIRGTNGKSNGIVPFLRMYNDGARAFNQGGKRNGSFAMYLEPHHPDILKFLELRSPHGDENLRCRDLFLALWISDLFMKRVQNNELWSTFCPDVCPGLNDVYGEEYEKLYLEYEEKKMWTSQIPARNIWKAIFKSQKESGMPYMLYKDTINERSMQKNIGVVKSSNLCSEITLVSSTEQYAVCNLSSICLPSFVEDTYTKDELLVSEYERRPLNHEFPINPKFNYKKLAEIAADITENLNNVIDKNWNPVLETARSNFNNRPIGIGIQGLADVFLKFRIPFESKEAKKLNKNISEAIYYGALSKSTELCRTIYQKINRTIDSHEVYKKNVKIEVYTNGIYKHTLYTKDVLKQYPQLEEENLLGEYTKETLPKDIGSYPTYKKDGGSPLYNGKFHWELYGLDKEQLSGMFDWETLREHIKIYGVRNSMTTAYMPTASTSQIMGNSICFEPYMSNIYTRTTLAGTFPVINKYLMKDLQDLGLWNEDMKSYLLVTNGSVQNIEGIPPEIKELYKTGWEIKQKNIMDLAIDRQPFIDQSQSMNLHMEVFDLDKFTSMQFYAWKNKLKTGSYYVRTREAVSAQKFTVSHDMQKQIELGRADVNIDQEEETCLLCSS